MKGVGNLSLAAASLFAGCMGAGALLSCNAGIVVYPEYDARIERDHAYAVRVAQGGARRMVPVYNHCEKSVLERRTRGGDVNRRFCEFAFDGGPARVEIAFCEDVKSYSVFPARLGLKSSFKDGVLSVSLERPVNFGVRINDYDKTILSVFADAPESPAKVPRKDDEGVLFVEGWMDPPGEDGVLVVQDPIKEVYIAPGAVLNARLLVKSKGAYVHGRGMMLDPMSDAFRFDQAKNTKRGFFRVQAQDATVEDVKLVDSRTFNFCSWANNVTFRNVKALSSMMCSDGMTCGGSPFDAQCVAEMPVMARQVRRDRGGGRPARLPSSTVREGRGNAECRDGCLSKARKRNVPPFVRGAGEMRCKGPVRGALYI